MNHISLATKVRALSAVAGFLGADLTTLRAAGKRLRHLGVRGGCHVVESRWDGRQFSVDLVIESVDLVVGVPYREAHFSA